MNNRRTMFDSGIITLDYVMCIKPPGAVRDYGYLFYITREKMKHLFPIERVDDLNVSQ